MARRRSRRFSPPRLPGVSLRRLLSLTLIVASLLGGGLFLHGRVVSVTDGDTLTVLSERGPTTVRLYGIDCPEGRQTGGNAATQVARELVFLREVRLEVLDTDRYGRSVALIHLPDGRTLNEELVRQGHAWVYTAYCKRPICAAWKTMELKARAEKKGLWSTPNPEPPWRWRERHRR